MPENPASPNPPRQTVRKMCRQQRPRLKARQIAEALRQAHTRLLFYLLSYPIVYLPHTLNTSTPARPLSRALLD